MSATPLFEPAGAGPSASAAPAVPAPRATTRQRRRVVDAPTRLFHWLFAASFLGAYLTADGERWRALHVTLGYTLAGLLAFRLLYGLFGPRPARLAPMLRKLAGAPAWLRAAAAALRPGAPQALPWRQGQHLLMASAVVGLLVLAAPLTLSGYGTYQEWGEGFGGEGLEDLHEFLGNAFLALVLAHVGLIAGLSLLRRKNQALPMLTGHIDGPGPDLVRHNHAGLAVALGLAVIVFVAWQWQQSPHGLVPGSGLAAASANGPAGEAAHDDHDDD